MTGNNYTNPNEMQIDAELEVCRQIRDKLGGAVEQWRTSSTLLRTSAKSALVAKEHYILIQTERLVGDLFIISSCYAFNLNIQFISCVS